MKRNKGIMIEAVKKRIDYLDYAKGLTIILMVLAHSMAGDNSIKTWIESFFMPIFFIVSGILLYTRFGDKISAVEVKNLFKKRVFQLGVPYFVFSMLISLFYVFLQIISGSPITLSRFLISIITLHGVESMWFIPCIFIAEIVLALVLCCGMKVKWLAGIFSIWVIVFITLFSNCMPTNETIRLLIVWAVGFLFEYIGMMIARYEVIEKMKLIAGLVLLVMGGDTGRNKWANWCCCIRL